MARMAWANTRVRLRLRLPGCRLALPHAARRKLPQARIEDFFWLCEKFENTFKLKEYVYVCDHVRSMT